MGNPRFIVRLLHQLTLKAVSWHFSCLYLTRKYHQTISYKYAALIVCLIVLVLISSASFSDS